MAWYPDAVKMELQPESDKQEAIRPTQFIVHSIVAPWTARRTYEYWRDSTNLESHFGVDYEGTVGQYIGTETRADANAGANRRGDGTGAVSAETASNTKGSDPWNAKQVEDLIAIGVWLHQRHGIPLRICRTHSDPGFGYHSMFPQWSTSGTACPGVVRIKQFREVVFPGIVARANGKTTAPEKPSKPTTPTAPAATPEEDDPMPDLLTESSDTDTEVPGGEWSLLAMAKDSALLQGPCSYTVTAYATVIGAPGTRVTGRYQDLTLSTKRASLDLPMDAGVIGADGRLDVALTRPGKLAAGVQLKLELLASAPVTVTYRVLRGLVWR
ncbi:peptidoglycan recognition protein family protein [Streptomyces microflavus]|uniref:peptidoglycan recognition protein family protein n=1 Tax=Streptomyces TaxID=1883 RepID=UPI000515C125|nr:MULTISPECIES: N-acetylmuramoyl-L-alanine amidase [Streptomyces]MDX2981198.1 N-acetylmuramoyl-L-alanine amidase [Streptomyces sp. NRRL_B-2249]